MIQIYGISNGRKNLSFLCHWIRQKKNLRKQFWQSFREFVNLPINLMHNLEVLAYWMRMVL